MFFFSKFIYYNQYVRDVMNLNLFWFWLTIGMLFNAFLQHRPAGFQKISVNRKPLQSFIYLIATPQHTWGFFPDMLIQLFKLSYYINDNTTSKKLQMQSNMKQAKQGNDEAYYGHLFCSQVVSSLLLLPQSLFLHIEIKGRHTI